METNAFEQVGHKGAHAAPPLRNLRWLVQLGIGIALLWWMVRWVDIDLEQLWAAVARASPLDLALAIVFFAVSIALKTIQFRICLSLSVSNVYLFGLILSQNALLTILPWRIGEISVPMSLRRNQDVPLTKAVSSVVMIRLIDLMFIVAIVTLSGSRFGILISSHTVVVFVIIFGALAYLGKRFSQRSTAPKFVRAIGAALGSLANVVVLGSTVMLSAGVFVTSTLQSAFALRAFGLTIPLVDVAILNAVTLLVAVLPLHPPGGWGTIDFVQVVLLRQLDFQPEVTTPVILVTHGFYTLLVVLGGFFGFWLCRSISRR